MFDVRGRRYVWHQPEDLVDWDVACTSDEVTEYKSGESGGVRFSAAISNLYMLTVYEYLRMREFSAAELPQLTTFWKALCYDWYWSRPRVWLRQKKWSLQTKLRNLRSLLTYVETGEMPELEDEIPF